MQICHASNIDTIKTNKSLSELSKRNIKNPHMRQYYPYTQQVSNP